MGMVTVISPREQTDWQTYTTEKITFSQLRWQTASERACLTMSQSNVTFVPSNIVISLILFNSKNGSNYLMSCPLRNYNHYNHWDSLYSISYLSYYRNHHKRLDPPSRTSPVHHLYLRIPLGGRRRHSWLLKDIGLLHDELWEYRNLSSSCGQRQWAHTHKNDNATILASKDGFFIFQIYLVFVFNISSHNFRRKQKEASIAWQVWNQR